MTSASNLNSWYAISQRDPLVKLGNRRGERWEAPSPFPFYPGQLDFCLGQDPGVDAILGFGHMVVHGLYTPTLSSQARNQIKM